MVCSKVFLKILNTFVGFVAFCSNLILGGNLEFSDGSHKRSY